MIDKPTPAPNIYLPSGIRQVEKLNGGDIEVGNLIDDPRATHGTGRVASRLLLGEFDGFPRRTSRSSVSSYQGSTGTWSWNGGNVQDWGRKYFTNGSCVYIDLDHLEICLPEVLSAGDHVAALHALFRETRDAMNSANAKLPDDRQIVVLLNNSDGLSNSYGSHLNFLLTRRAWDNIFSRRLQYLLFLAAYQVSSIIFTGQGKVGSENGAAPVRYALSQRADFFERLFAVETTFARPIVNARNETLCGPSWMSPGTTALGSDLARLHVIFYDTNLCHTAIFLKVGVMQIILAMIEAEHTDASLILEDPIEAVHEWSRDSSLQARARSASGGDITALELQFRFLEAASQFVEAGGCVDVVPGAERIIALWGDTLEKLEARNFDALIGKLDWVTKESAIQGEIDRDATMSWDSPLAKTLDHAYSVLDPEMGIYWGYEADYPGMSIVSGERIERFRRHPPEDTRAWTRGKLLEIAEADAVSHVDWNELRIWEEGSGNWPRLRTLKLGDPTRFTKTETGHLFDGPLELGEVLDELDAINEGAAVS